MTHSFQRVRILIAFLALSSLSLAHEPVVGFRSPIHIPDPPGYVTLKCDFHMHTVFSDGLVWPSVRAEEAWRQGLDVIAITDHIEYQPHKDDVVKNHNRSYAIAKDAGDDLRLIVLAGSEITRSMPPGHLNAIFLTNAALLETKEWRDAVGAAHDQKAFIFWNHPGWEPQLANGKVEWHAEHTELLNQGKIHGIEVVNGRDYYPEAHRWAMEHKLAMLGNSDIHQPLNLDYNVHEGDLRPMTLVFSKERTATGIREALFERRTAVFGAGLLVGEEQFLRPIFERSIKLDRAEVRIKPRKSAIVQISNESGLNYQLELVDKPAGFSAPARLTLPGGKTVLLTLRASSGEDGLESATVEYRVTNLLIAPGEPMRVTLPLTIAVERGSR